MAVEFATCSYPEFTPRMGVPIRATVGAPRYRLPYLLGGAMPEAAPERWFMQQEYGPFRESLRAKLDKIGVEQFTSVAEAIASRAGQPDGRVVFLCFENGLNRKGWCHRAMLAEWLREQTGQEVPELGTLSPDDPSAGAEPPPFEEMELF
ncbi:DUF488 family protein [Streptomyces yaizuensis]|uniref:DUF488 domain-containing protein n=1 Tax=Streptomyces yaizuensis TaxID=2989713 RepID=A0AA86J3N6_9ACTN|nr:hypothetical protein [Streptomyces sp. YSPA8]BDT39492.1 DUF488 domain-containing protein [Streptomyces sp. YSPA8]